MFCRVEIMFVLLNQPPLYSYLYIHAFHLVFNALNHRATLNHRVVLLGATGYRAV